MAQQQLSPVVIKLGGAVLSSLETLHQLFITIAQYQAQAQRGVVIVHGGGYLVDELMEKLHLSSVKKLGLRVTPAEHIPFITGALAGTANKMLQGQAIKAGVRGVGLCLADGGLCQVEQLNPELGAVGNASAGDPQLVQMLVDGGFVPIISSIGLTQEGEMMNVNADQAAVAVANALNAELILLSDVSGVLDAKGHLIEQLDAQAAQHLIAQEVITDGMIVKVNAALQAAKELGRSIEVTSWRYPEKLVKLLAGERIGTRFLP